MLTVGEQYPSPQDSKRITLETYYENLLLNKSTGNYEMREVNGRLTKVPKDPLVPIPQTISDISADLLMGEFPKIILPEARQEAFEDWAFQVGLQTRYLEAATYVSAIGTVFQSMFKIDDMPMVTLQPANRVTWSEKFGKFENVRFILSVSTTKSGNEKLYEIQDWSKPGDQLTIEHYLAKVRISDSEVLELRQLTPTQRPGLDFIPIAKWLNMGVMGQANGRSDYSGKSQLFSEIDNRVDQNNDVLQENAEPWKAVPAGILDQNGQLQRANFSAKMFEKTMGGQADNSVDIMTWDAQMAASFQQIETMVDMTFFTSRLSNSITGREKGGVSESGRALKWKSVSTIAMKQRKEKYAGDFIKNSVNHWSRMTGEEVEKQDIKIVWQDGLPIDEQEKTETIVAQVNAGLMSKETAIKQLQELNDEDAQKELQRIQADEVFATEQEARAVSPIVV